MSVVPPLTNPQIESLSQALGDCGSGSEISSVLTDLNLYDHAEGHTKWRRLNEVFRGVQQRDGNANRILTFVEDFLAPTRFINRNEKFEAHRSEVNVVLSFSGIEYGADGKFRQVRSARTLTEAETRASTIRAKFQGMQIHAEVLKYCRAELMEDNYFHAALEASKGLAQRIREMSGAQADGEALVNLVFLNERPLLAFNSLETETEKSEHRGFANLLRGCFALLRNPRAHEPRILWQENEHDAADCFLLISLLHRKLDNCFVVRLREDQ